MIAASSPHYAGYKAGGFGFWAEGLMMTAGQRAGLCTVANEPPAHRPGPTCPPCFGGGGGEWAGEHVGPKRANERACERRCHRGRSIGPVAVVRPDRRQFVRALRAYARTPLLEVRANGRSLLRGEHPSGVLRFGFPCKVRTKVRANELPADPEFARKLLGAVCLRVCHAHMFAYVRTKCNPPFGWSFARTHTGERFSVFVRTFAFERLRTITQTAGWRVVLNVRYERTWQARYRTACVRTFLGSAVIRACANWKAEAFAWVREAWAFARTSRSSVVTCERSDGSHERLAWANAHDAFVRTGVATPPSTPSREVTTHEVWRERACEAQNRNHVTKSRPPGRCVVPSTRKQPKARAPRGSSTKRQPKAKGKGSGSSHKRQLRKY